MKRKKREHKSLKTLATKLFILKEPLEIKVDESDDLRNFPKEDPMLRQNSVTFTIKGRK